MREKSAEKIGLKHSPLQRLSKYRLVQTFAKSLQVHKILDRFLRGIRARHGLVGGGNLESKPFYLNSTSFLSSAFAQRHPGQKLSDPLETVDVPVLDVEKLWKEEFGNRQIDRLKIDIEGSELDLIRQNPGLLLQSNRLIIESHKWLVPEAEVLGRLDALGFRVLLRLNEDQDSVVIVCER